MAEDWRPPAALSDFADLDHDRAARRGYPEAVYCEGKTTEQVAAIAASIAAAADAGATLVLIVVDGRQPGEATGMSLTELGQLMLDLGCHDALNLDGGGSSNLVLRDPLTGELKVINRPSDGRERAVVNVLGVSIRGSVRARIAAPVKPAEKPQ